MEFWRWITCQLSGDEDPVTCDRWCMDCPSHVLVAQLLKSIPIVNWHETLVEGNVLTTAFYLALERYRENYNDYEIELLSAIDSLKRDYYRRGVIDHLF